MDFLVCAYGEPEEEAFIPFIRDLVNGVELQNYDRKGVVSDEAWRFLVERHQSLVPKLPGRLAVHGPYEGIDFGYRDWLLKAAVKKRMDMVYDMVCRLKPDTLVLHSGCSDIMLSFGLSDIWLERAVTFWKEEICRYAEQGVRVVIENIVEESPEAMIALADGVGSDWLGLCLDVGHAHMRSHLSLDVWVKKMGKRLAHVHLHDNNGTDDEHLPVGQGTIDFEGFFAALYTYAPGATVSLEVVGKPDVVVENLQTVIGAYREKP